MSGEREEKRAAGGSERSSNGAAQERRRLSARTGWKHTATNGELLASEAGGEESERARQEGSVVDEEREGKTAGSPTFGSAEFLLPSARTRDFKFARDATTFLRNLSSLFSRLFSSSFRTVAFSFSPWSLGIGVLRNCYFDAKTTADALVREKHSGAH